MRTEDIMNAHKPASDLEFWYRPWQYAHPSRIAAAPRWLAQSAAEAGAAGGAGTADELRQRLRYPAWCAAFGLARQPAGCDGSIWWKIAALPADAFERVNRLAGLALLFCANRRGGLMLTRAAAARRIDADDLRWALQYASVVPAAAIGQGAWSALDDPDASGCLALRFAVRHAAPALSDRIALRYRPEHAELHEESVAAERSMRFLTRLWQAAAQRAGVRLNS
jgi:hypothetical protein